MMATVEHLEKKNQISDRQIIEAKKCRRKGIIEDRWEYRECYYN